MIKYRHLLNTILVGTVLFGLALFSWIKAPSGYSLTERRTLAQLPQANETTLTTGTFMRDFETYSQDQFPMRDGFRKWKAFASMEIFGQKDNHGLYLAEEHVSKLEYPLNRAKIGLAVKKLQEIQKSYLAGTDCKTYLSIIPDKNYYLAEKNGYPSLDYEQMIDDLQEKVPCDAAIDLRDLLELSDYYHTDQHWRQECLTDVAQRILETMGDVAETADYEECVLENDFYGAYVGQIARTMQPDSIHYLTNETLGGCKVTSFHTGTAQESDLYDMEKAFGRDPYEMFLGGADPLLVIENPKAKSDKELVVFRDSFGSSLVPLLVEPYAKITVVDLRYMRSDLLGNYLTFGHQDVLFLYSTLILNNNISM